MSDWRPGASRAALVARAELFAQIRLFFARRQVLEVDTPILARYGVTDSSIEPLQVSNSLASAVPLYLQSSPEFAMKRLLSAGFGDIYQLGKVFRDAEVGRRHNPEFTMLEWYRLDFDLHQLIDEVAALVCDTLGEHPITRLTYQEIFQEELGIDPWAASVAELETLACQRLGHAQLELDHDAWLDLLMSHCIEPALSDRGMVFVYDYPPTQAALARCSPRGERQVAERFELYVGGMELANGYRELRDTQELERRAQKDNQRRSESARDLRELDPKLLAAMQAGLPDCSGVALGVDRLLMLRLRETEMQAVLPFDWSRC